MSFSFQSAIIPGNVLQRLNDYRAVLYREGASPSLLSLPVSLPLSADPPEQWNVPAGSPLHTEGWVYLPVEGLSLEMVPQDPLGVLPHNVLLLGFGNAPSGQFDGAHWKHMGVVDIRVHHPNDPWWEAVSVEFRFLA